jgi:hypothetical protein
MKFKIVFLFLFISIAFTNSAYSDSYFGYNSFGGTWYDANKSYDTQLDDPFCQLAAASNVLMYTGWNAGFSNADAIFTHFWSNWTNPNPSVNNAYSWWLNGTYITANGTYTMANGNFYPGNPFAAYYHNEIDTRNVLPAIDNFLHKGYGVTLTIANPVGWQHFVTVWGYKYDAQGNYLGIYITDSDDRYAPGPTPPTISYYDVIYDPSNLKWWIQNYQIATCWWWGKVFYIQSVEALDRTPVPEPSTMLLLGSGLIGLAGYGRKKFFKK